MPEQLFSLTQFLWSAKNLANAFCSLVVSEMFTLLFEDGFTVHSAQICDQTPCKI
jgi:hypothetical protein